MIESVNLPIQIPFFVGRLENIKVQEVCDFHRHNYFEFLWFTDIESQGLHYVESSELALVTDTVLLLTPNQVHKFDKVKVKGYVFQFSKEYFIDLLGAAHPFCFSANYFCAILSDVLKNHLELLVQLIEQEYSDKRRGDLLSFYFKALFVHITDVFVSREFENQVLDKTLVDFVLKLVDKNYKTQKQLSFYSNHLAVNQRTLNKVMLEHTGVSLKQFIYNRIILEAKRLLYTNDLLIKEIAFELGFKDVAHFNKVFQKQVGMSPLDFRKAYQNQFIQ
ncbi:helix-turn-helix domain-containing protein [Myroides albus]|uniref:Helix-turn-helix domain-containing protein n=1 Tax=Myroides albus TaxID=2562892 RepID=A0A6I3LKA7_9FLAO|nr:helix-turn-helix domain-containing protein [Myroides albus]MTG98743.1 helix-turn-helix domain-containing protein [Myroides albus]UVD79059.1 helix-turn-helix domain-containing protein [Myroides albus]